MVRSHMRKRIWKTFTGIHSVPQFNSGIKIYIKNIFNLDLLRIIDIYSKIFDWWLLVTSQVVHEAQHRLHGSFPNREAMMANAT